MDYQASARFEKGEVKTIDRDLWKETLATGNHRIASWAQKAASKEQGIACIDSQETWLAMRKRTSLLSIQVESDWTDRAIVVIHRIGNVGHMSAILEA
jgi:hypothetical protein